MNVLILSGRLTADPEIRYTADKTPYCKFTLAVQDTKDKADFIQCTAWRDNAEWIAKSVRKGDRLAVRGEWTSGSYDKGGVRIYTNECTIHQFEYIEPRRNGEPSDAAEPAIIQKQTTFTPADEGLPF